MSDGCLRSHFQPTWPQQLAPFLSRTPSCQADPAQWTAFLTATRQPGHPASVSRRWVQHPTSNRLGIDQVCWQTSRLFRASWLTLARKPHSWLRPLHTQETGLLCCQLPAAVCVWMTRPSEWRLHFVLVSNCAFLTLVAAAVKSTPGAFFHSSANELQDASSVTSRSTT